MLANSRFYEIGIHDMSFLPRVPIVANLTILVFNNGSATLASLYTDPALSVAKTNPISSTVFAVDNRIAFYTDQTSVDICVFSGGFGSGWFTNVTPNVRELAVPAASDWVHLVVGHTVQNAATDTGIDLPANFLIQDVLEEVITAVASGTISWGILAGESGGDADGFIVAQDAATAGLFRPTTVVTTGSNTKFFAASTTRGALLCDHQAGTDVDQDEGVAMEKPHLCDGTAESLDYTASNHAIAGRIHILGRMINT